MSHVQKINQIEHIVEDTHGCANEWLNMIAGVQEAERQSAFRSIGFHKGLVAAPGHEHKIRRQI